MVLSEALAQLERDARRTWPARSVPSEVFRERAARAVSGEADPVPALDALCGADLLLACALEAGEPAALAEMERLLASSIRSALRRLDPSPSFADEICQLVRQRILMADGERPPQLREFKGRGPFERWLRAVAIGTGLDVLRRRKREVPLDDATLWEEPLAHGDAELRYLRARHHADFREALRDGLGALSPREQTLLRLNLVAGLNIEEIGRLYGVHRATVARWIARSREAVLERARRFLGERLQVPESEVDSLFRHMRSQLEVSLSQLADEPAR